jgi:hypothetical protein
MKVRQNLQWPQAGLQLGFAAGDDHTYRRMVRPARDVPEEKHRFPVRPVQVLDHEKDWGFTRHGLQQSGEGFDVTVIIAPVGQAFRGELPAAGPHCAF